MNTELVSENDGYLWQLVQQDNEPAFTVLYKRYWATLFTTAFSYLKDRTICTDIVHDIFISIWKRRHQLEIISFHHYLTNAARYKVYKLLRTGGKSKPRYVHSFEDDATGILSNNAEDKFAYQDLEKKLDHHLNKLPKRCREIFVLSRKEYFTNEEISQRLQISKRTVENQITYALQQLRLVLGNLIMILIILYWVKG